MPPTAIDSRRQLRSSARPVTKATMKRCAQFIVAASDRREPADMAALSRHSGKQGVPLPSPPLLSATCDRSMQGAARCGDESPPLTSGPCRSTSSIATTAEATAKCWCAPAIGKARPVPGAVPPSSPRSSPPSPRASRAAVPRTTPAAPPCPARAACAARANRIPIDPARATDQRWSSISRSTITSSSSATFFPSCWRISRWAAMRICFTLRAPTPMSMRW